MNPYSRNTHRTAWMARGAALLLLLPGLSWPVIAQEARRAPSVTASPSGQPTPQVRTLAIRDGKVYIDGHLVAADRLPASLDPARLDARFSFIGDAVPVVELNGRFYRLDGRQLTEVGRVGEGGAGVPVVFGPNARTPSPGAMPFGVAPQQERAGSPLEAMFNERVQTVMAQQMEVLNRQARELEQLSGAIARQDAPHDAAQLAQRMRRQAAQMSEMALALPELELQHYLSDIEQADRELYERLLRERTLEAETVRLAAHIRTLGEGPARHAQARLLRSKLEEIFELKQENRRREIEQLKQQLNGLQQRLLERQKLHDRIVDQRVEELLGGGR